jgi:HSP20 family protein
MRPRHQSLPVPFEISEFADEVRRIFAELGQAFSPDALTGQCAPAVDVFETDALVEVVVDLPGVDARAVRVVAKGDALLVVGEKTARRPHVESSFHLVERGFGRFARSVRLGHAVDLAHARAAFVNGELRVTLPKIADRRGRPHTIPIESA